MNIWAKMMTALRGGVNEAGEAVIDSQALRILDQEVRDASDELNQSKNGLAEIIARQKLAEEKAKQLKKSIDEHDGYALKALEQDDEALAHEVANKIAELENLLQQELESQQGFADSANSLRHAIAQTENNLKRMKQQIDTVKATENVQRAQAAVAERHSGSNSKTRTAMDSLERIKEKQALKAAQMNAAEELSQDSVDANLQDRLEKAGITSGANRAEEVLARLRSKDESQ